MEDEDPDFDAHAKQTRINFGTDTVLADGDKLSTRFEIDFFGSVTGNQRTTNTYAPVLRHAYVAWREWLISAAAGKQIMTVRLAVPLSRCTSHAPTIKSSPGCTHSGVIVVFWTRDPHLAQEL